MSSARRAGERLWRRVLRRVTIGAVVGVMLGLLVLAQSGRPILHGLDGAQMAIVCVCGAVCSGLVSALLQPLELRSRSWRWGAASISLLPFYASLLFVVLAPDRFIPFGALGVLLFAGAFGFALEQGLRE